MNKKIRIAIAAAIATATVGAAAWAVAAKTGYSCCNTPTNACCVTKKPCCN